MAWKFKEDSVLNKYSEYTPCKDIFQAVCDEIGQYYVDKGGKYARSRPKITFKNADLKIEITFWSSGYNIPGEYVNLEMIPSIYSLELVKKAKEEGEKIKGHILSFMDVFTERWDDKPKGSKLIINAFGERLERVDEYNSKTEIKYNKSVNVYGITEEKFESLIHFIDSRITHWIESIHQPKNIQFFLDKLIPNDKTELLNGDFGTLLKLKFPDVNFR
ncbi:MAG: hypothetical protein MI810_02000 [Flavobacteriales bacterium]|nr:hypothetical protein [Flavobacteriales bacterium]